MGEEDVVHMYNGILLSHKKEWKWVICGDVEGPRDCQTEWSKSEREKQILYIDEKQILYIDAHTWNLNKLV